MKKSIKKLIMQQKEILSFLLPVYNRLNFRNGIKRYGNICHTNCALLKKCSITVCGNNNIIIIHDWTRLTSCKKFIRGDNNHIEIGSNCILCGTEFWIEDDNGSIEIGKETTMGKVHLASIENTSIKIGMDCMFSSNIHIRTGDSHNIMDLNGYRINPSKDITIGDHVWIGIENIILKGTKIPNNCIIGAGSVVNKEFKEENCVIAGNIAKILKRGIIWERECN